MILWHFIAYILAEDDLNYFVEKDVRIFVSAANHIFLGVNLSEGEKLISKSKYSNIKDFRTKSNISKDGDFYRIKVDESYICEKDDRIAKCAQAQKWRISESPFGYSISQNDRCITIFAKSFLKMMPCTNSTDQIFDFKLANEDQACGNQSKEPEQEKKKEPQIVVNIDRNLLNSNYFVKHNEEDDHSDDHGNKNDGIESQIFS